MSNDEPIMSNDEKVSSVIMLVMIGVCFAVYVYYVSVSDAALPKQLFLEGKILDSGQIVYTKLGNNPVQVIIIYPRSERVSCRVLSGRHNRDGLVSKDSYKGEYVEVEFNVYELTRKKGGE